MRVSVGERLPPEIVMREIISQIERLRGRGRLLLFAQRSSVISAAVVGALIAAGALDFVFRFPGGFRLVLLLAGLAALGWCIVRRVVPTLSFRPSLTEVALRIERTVPSLQGRLASSVEFASTGIDRQNALAARSLRDTESRASAADLNTVIDPRRTRRDLLLLAVSLFVAMLISVAAPAAAGTALKRILLPLGSAQWPARTAVESLMMSEDVHPRGQSLVLRALGTKAPFDAVDRMEIRARYRYRADAQNGPWREAVLIHQREGMYERLVEADADSIEFYFEADDSRTAVQRIAFIPPPAVRSAVLSVTPPSYALEAVGESTIDLGPGVDERSMPGAAHLRGSQATLKFDLNKSIPLPAGQSERDAWLASTLGWSAGSVRAAGEAEAVDTPPLPTLRAHGTSISSFEISWRLEGTTSMVMNLVDEHGLGNVENIAYRIDVVADRPPSVTITQPESDQPVLRSAVVPIEAEARDDVAVAGVGLELHRPVTGAAGEGERLWYQWEDVRGVMTGRITRDLDLARLAIEEGQTLEVSAVAADTYYLDGEGHPQVRSAVRRLRIISEREFGETLLRDLRALREHAIRLETQQAELQDDVIDDGVQPGVRQAQDRIGERVAEQLQSVRQMQQRARQNRFEDGSLTSLMEQAEDLLRHAGAASTEASQAIEARQHQTSRERPAAPDDRAADEEDPQGGQPSETGQRAADTGRPGDESEADRHASQPRTGEPGETGDPQQGAAGEPIAGDDDEARPDDPTAEPAPEARQPAEEDREIVERQQQVRDELRDLIESLDRNEDTWVMQQRIRDLLDRQAQLQRDTEALAEQTRGRALDELEQPELSEIDRIERAQRDLAEAMRDVTDDLRQRAGEMEQVDPQAAEAQRRAADTAEQREIDREMEQAAESARENRLQNAQNSQQRAREGLERMLEDIDRRRAEAEELNRRLQSLVESIGRLINIQENEINLLARAMEENDFSGRDRAMIRLNQNTQAVASEARAAGRETARIARTLDRAGDAQSAAIVALRASPVAGDEAEFAERRSLELLREALALAEELQQETEDQIVQERREALLRAYREIVEREMALRGSTLELQQVAELGRRELVEARRHSGTQEDIRIALDRVRAETQEISDSLVFRHVHSLLDEWAREVVDGLREGDVSVRITDRQFTIADAVARLVKALEEEFQPPDEFEEGNQGGGGGESGQSSPQPLIPPIAELKLLRGLQEQIYDQTRNLDARDDLDDAARRARLRDLGRHQQSLKDLGQQMLEALQSSMPPGQGAGDRTPPPGGPQ